MTDEQKPKSELYNSLPVSSREIKALPGMTLNEVYEASKQAEKLIGLSNIEIYGRAEDGTWLVRKLK